MPISTKTKQLGQNSWAVGYGPGATNADIHAGVIAACVAGGWVVFDVVSPTYVVLTARMEDSPTVLKYVLIYVSTREQFVIDVYESWNATTHVGTNLAYNSAGGGGTNNGQLVDLQRGGSIYVLAHPRWLVLYSKITDVTGVGTFGAAGNNSWTSCIEIMKENSGEVTGAYPRFALVSAHALGGGAQYPDSLTTVAYGHWAPPRSKNGALGFEAARNCVMSAITVPMAAIPAESGSIYCNGQNAYLGYVNAYTNDTWASSFPYASDQAFGSKDLPLAVVPYASDVLTGPRGAFWGMKIMASKSGSILDTVGIKVGAADFKPSVFGNTMSHILLGGVGIARVAFPL